MHKFWLCDEVTHWETLNSTNTGNEVKQVYLKRWAKSSQEIITGWWIKDGFLFFQYFLLVIYFIHLPDYKGNGEIKVNPNVNMTSIYFISFPPVSSILSADKKLTELPISAIQNLTNKCVLPLWKTMWMLFDNVTITIAFCTLFALEEKPGAPTQRGGSSLQINRARKKGKSPA